MPLEPNTQTFIDVLSDVKPKLESGELTSDNAEDYLIDTWGITPDEYNDALTKAKDLEDKYFKFKEEHGESFLSFLPITSSFIPAHLRATEETTAGRLLDFPGRAGQAAITGAIKGVGQLIEPVVPESVKEMGQKVDKALSENEYTAPIIAAAKSTFDPALTIPERIGGEVLATALPGAKITKTLGAIASPALKLKKGFGAINSMVSFAIADTLFTDKNESLARTLVETFPETAPYLENLAVNPDDPVALNALRKFGEGLGLGAITDTLLRGAAFGFRKLKGKSKAIEEKVFEPPPNDPVGKIKTTEVVEMPDGTVGQKLTIQQPVDILSGVESAPEIKTGMAAWLKRNFTSNQGLDPQTYQVLINRDSQLRGARAFAVQKAKNLEDAIKQDYKVKNYMDLSEEIFDTISTALGKQPLIEEAAPTAIKKILQKSTLTKKEKTILDDYTNKVYESARAEQKAALDSLPESTRNTVKDLRVAIDDYSNEIKKLNLNEKVNVTLDRNMGLYTHTDYEAFTNPRYQKLLKDTYKGTIDDADAGKAIANLHEYGRRKAISDSSEELSKEVIEDEARKFVDKFMVSIDKGEEGALDFLNLIGRGGRDANLGRQLSARTVIPDILKPVLKEVRDPLRIAETTLSQQGKLLAEHKFASQLRNIANSSYGKNIFNIGVDYRKGFSEELSSLGNAYLKAIGGEANPLANIYVNKQFKKYLDEGLDVGFSDSPIMKTFYTSNFLASTAQTVLSEATHLINIKGNVVMSLANGNLSYVFRNGFKNVKDVNKAFPGIERFFKSKKGESFKIDLKEYKKLQDLGVVDTGVFAEYVGNALKNSFFNKNTWYSKLTKMPYELYRAEDTIFKVFNYYSELDKYSKAFKNMPRAELEQYAANTVKNTLPTYTRIPRAFQSISRNPLIGVFPSFASESVRVLKNTYKIGYSDFINGIKTGNAELTTLGLKRLAHVAAASIYFMSGEFSNKEKHSISKNDDNVVNSLAPTYERNSSRKYDSQIFKNTKTGNFEVSYYNQSALNPYDVPMKIMAAVYGAAFGKDNVEQIMENAFNIAQPYTSLSLGFEPIYRIATGKTTKGYELADRFGSKAFDIFVDTTKKYVPRTITDVADYIDSLPAEVIEEKLQKSYLEAMQRGEINKLNEYGSPIRPENKLARLLGQSRATMDINKSLNYKVREIKNEIGDINKNFNILLRRFENKVGVEGLSPESEQELYKEINNLMRDSYSRQQKLAKLFYDFKKGGYSQENKKTGKIEKIPFSDATIREILSNKGFKNYDKDMDTNFLNIRGNKVGQFIPFNLSENQINELGIKKFSNLPGRIPSQILLNIKEMLLKAEYSGIPLLEIGE